MIRKSTAEWKGNLREGRGTVSTESGLIDRASYSFGTRFEGQKGTNPEELVAAAHAACFSMALSGELEKAGMKADSIQTEAALTLDPVGGWSITEVMLSVRAVIPNGDQAKFDIAANSAKTNCPISKLLKARINLIAKMDSVVAAR